MIRFRIQTAVLLLPLALLTACGGGRSAPQDPEVLLERGMSLYADGKYRKAAEFLDRFLSARPGDARVPEVLLTLGRARMASGDELTAVADFLRVVNSHPGSPQVPDARRGMCEAYADLSPRYPLDQEYTRTAIVYCESYLSLFPDAPTAPEVRERIAGMRTRLARKAYETGVFYLRRKAYDSALIYFNETVAEYPDTGFAPAALLKLLETYERIGYEEEAADARARLLRDYPQSDEARSLAG